MPRCAPAFSKPGHYHKSVNITENRYAKIFNGPRRINIIISRATDQNHAPSPLLLFSGAEKRRRGGPQSPAARLKWNMIFYVLCNFSYCLHHSFLTGLLGLISGCCGSPPPSPPSPDKRQLWCPALATRPAPPRPALQPGAGPGSSARTVSRREKRPWAAAGSWDVALLNHLIQYIQLYERFL